MGPFFHAYHGINTANMHMPLSKDQISELIFCVQFYQQMHLSIHSRRYREYDELIKLLEHLKFQRC